MEIELPNKTQPSERNIKDEIARLEADIIEHHNRLALLRREIPPEPIHDYEFGEWAGNRVKLSDLFNGKEELIVVHNMGKSCAYCTLWADGFIGITKHLEDRAAFVLTSPDDPETQRRFARDRGWTFRMLSTKGTTFKHDMGFEPEPGRYWPGVSVFRKDENGRLYHVSKANFGPGDEFCSVWHFLGLLHTEVGWEPKFRYAS